MSMSCGNTGDTVATVFAGIVGYNPQSKALIDQQQRVSQLQQVLRNTTTSGEYDFDTNQMTFNGVMSNYVDQYGKYLNEVDQFNYTLTSNQLTTENELLEVLVIVCLIVSLYIIIG